MYKMLAVVSCVGTISLVAGCASEMTAALEDPGSFACRERAVGLMSVDFDATSATPINFDAFGNKNYSVRAGGETFRCTVGKNDQITSFHRG
jgi:hypothetical protein